MDINNIKGLFSIKEQPNKNQPSVVAAAPESDKISYYDYGFKQGGRLGGTTPGLRVCLQKIYQDFKQEVKDDIAKQEELKKPIRVKIEDYKGDIDRLQNKIIKVKEEYIPKVKEKIEKLKVDLSDIKKNPHLITGDDAGKASFIIGVFILFFLTLYLFIFYSSASYSAFFKEFSLNEIGVANSIFDAQALSKSLKDGFTELALILTIPFVFIGLGYLLHKFQEQKGNKKYFQITMLILVTFIFDSILAYEITEKIYNIKKDNSFIEMPEYNFHMAFTSVNFWLIIFAGFVVYLIWGFVFNFVMESYSKMDKVKVALDEKNKQIDNEMSELKDLENQIDKMTHVVSENKKEINKLNKILESYLIPKGFERYIFSFMEGWMTWMKQGGKTQGELQEASDISQEFVNRTINILDNLN